MQDISRHKFRSIFLTVVAGLTSAIVTTVVTLVFIRRAGLSWPGAVFGNQEFNWRDSCIMFLSLIAFVAGAIPTAMVTRIEDLKK